MRRIKTPRWAALAVLAVLCLRALVPAGFMVAPLDGHLAFVLCSAETSASAPQHQHHHHPGHGDGEHHDGVHADPTCPYAQSAGPAPLPTLPVLEGGAVLDLPVPPVLATQTFSSSGPTRQQTPRGPPSPA